MSDEQRMDISSACFQASFDGDSAGRGYRRPSGFRVCF